MLMYLYLNPSRAFVFKYTSIYLTPCVAITASGERDVKKHVYGRGEHSRIPLDGYGDYCAIQDPVIDTAAMKARLDDVPHVICINQLLQTSSDTSEDTSLGMETQTNATPEEIIPSELPVGKHIISHSKMIF